MFPYHSKNVPPSSLHNRHGTKLQTQLPSGGRCPLHVSVYLYLAIRNCSALVLKQQNALCSVHTAVGAVQGSLLSLSCWHVSLCLRFS